MAALQKPKVVLGNEINSSVVGPLAVVCHRFGNPTTIIGQDPVANLLHALKVAKYLKWPPYGNQRSYAEPEINLFIHGLIAVVCHWFGIPMTTIG